jgi:predicted nucleotidyltransferase
MSFVLDLPALEKTKNKSAYLRREAVNTFVGKLKEEEGENLLQVILFGSVARGDDHDDSDIDVFILLKNYDSLEKEKIKIKHKIYDIVTDIGNLYQHKIYISPFIHSEKTYLENGRDSLIYYNIADEGVVLYENPTYA